MNKIYQQIKDGKEYNKDELIVLLKVEKTRSLIGGVAVGVVFAVCGIIAAMGAGII